MSRIFLGIGAQKAGTSWLHRCLAVHPDIWMPPVKELHFFNERARQTGVAKLPPRVLTPRARVELKEFAAYVARAHDVGALAWGARYFLVPRSIEWYRKILSRSRRTLTGDITPAYSTLPETEIHRLAAELPEVRALLLLRNPIERAFSHAVMDLSPLAPNDVLSLPSERFLEHFRSGESVRRTEYTAMIDRWERVIGGDRLLVAFYEELSESPIRLLENVTTFLGAAPIDWAAVAPIGARVNAGQRAKMPDRYREVLSEMYREEIARLAERYAPYPERWLGPAR